MPNWVPRVAPDLCPRCGAYWECECLEVRKASYLPDGLRSPNTPFALQYESEPHSAMISPAVYQDGEGRIREIPGAMSETLNKFFDNVPDTFTFNKLDSLGLARAETELGQRYSDLWSDWDVEEGQALDDGWSVSTIDELLGIALPSSERPIRVTWKELDAP